MQSPFFINHCLSVIFRFLLSAIHRLSTQVLCLKIVFSNDTATLSLLYTLYLACSVFCLNSLSARSRSRYEMFL